MLSQSRFVVRPTWAFRRWRPAVFDCNLHDGVPVLIFLLGAQSASPSPLATHAAQLPLTTPGCPRIPGSLGLEAAEDT